MRDLLWRFVERRLSRVVRPAHLPSTVGDLAEDYARVRSTRGRIRAAWWLVRESSSLAHAYRAEGVLHGPAGRFSVADDFWHAWRRLAARPAAPLLCVLLLSTGIGLATAMFSIVDSMLLQPAPFPNPDQLVQQGFWRPEPAVMAAWRTSGMFDDVEAARESAFRLEDRAVSGWDGALVTSGIFEMLGVAPIRGRLFRDSDARPGSDEVIVLSEAIWRSAFAADPDLIGRHIRLAGASVMVIGIMPASFRFPAPDSVIWRPFDPSATTAQGTTVYGRLKSDVPWAEAEARTAAIARQFGRLPASYRGTPPFTAVSRTRASDFTSRALWLLLGGVALVFLVLCSNVSSVLLAHLAGRRRELGVCTALGASRARLIRQAATEHALIALAGTVGGVGLAWWLTSSVPDIFVGRSLNLIDIDLRALLAASGLGATAVVLAGMIPAWIGTRADPANAVRGWQQTGTESRSSRLAARVLVTGEAALACSLLVGSVLLVRSFSNLVHADRGVNLDGVVRVSLGELDTAFRSVEAMALGTAAIRDHVAGWPEVSEVALSREIPPSLHATASIQREPGETLEGTSAPTLEADRYRVDESFFAFYRIPIVRGRSFAPGDTEQDIVVSERLATALWPGLDPLGRTPAIGRSGSRVIGVAREIHLPTLQRDLDRPEFYTPLGDRSRTLYLNLRCRAACPNEKETRDRLAALHPAIVARVTRREDIYQSHLRLPRALADVGGLFAIVSVMTAAGGLFGVLTQTISRRRREFGIRTALGASPGQLRRLVLGDGLAMVGLGTALGVGGGWIVARALAGYQYGVTAGDPVTWAGVIGTIALTSLSAAWRPARHAARVDPVQLLREE